MNSLILCEGKTDCILLQYYLEKVYSWRRLSKSSFRIEKDSWSNLLCKDNNTLVLSETKGCSRLVEGLINAICRDEKAAPGNQEEYFDRVIIFTDNDDQETAKNLLVRIQNELQGTSAIFDCNIQVNSWNSGTIQAIEGQKRFELYIMLVPFNENGALETYLLNCIAEKDSYEKELVNQGNIFVDGVDPENKYLSHRRLRTKAKFDIYFSVRTAADQYAERQNILKSVQWENYKTIQNDFAIFAELG